MYLLKFKCADEHSLEDIKKQQLSFGSYFCYRGQGELECCYNYGYLSKKYCDNSLTKKNALEVLLQHCFKRYYLSSFASYLPQSVSRNRHLWKTYTKFNGFAILYSHESAVLHVDKNKNQWMFLKVHYENTEYNLTEFYDKFLEFAIGCENQEIINKRFLYFSNMERNHIMISDYLCQKTKYPFAFENEIRIVHLPTRPIDDDHISIDFVKPLKIFMLSNVSKEYKNEIKAICLVSGIKYEEVEPNSILNY